MARTLVTGGSGFIATQLIHLLLNRGDSVVTTVRSAEKGEKIRALYPGIPAEKFGFVIVEDIAKPDAFDKAVVSDPPFEVVYHTASPFYYTLKDAKTELLEPAIVGTTSILKAIKKSAQTVKTVVVTSSVAAVRDGGKPPKYRYTEADWCSLTAEAVEKNQRDGYRVSKTLAERSAWDFMKNEKPTFSLAVVNPSLVFGPVAPHSSLSAINTSNQRIYDFICGKFKDACPPTGQYCQWVDVRDVAEAHIAAAEKPEAAGKRFLVIAGTFTNAKIAEIIAQEFPAIKEKLPSGKALEQGSTIEGDCIFDNSRAKGVLGIKFRTLKESIVDTVKSLQALEKGS